jgi:hypothetical protein
MLRRARALAATVLVVAGFGIAVAPTASAASCTYFADLPAKVSIDRGSVQVPVVLRGCEGIFDSAYTNVYGPPGVVDFLYWNAGRTDYWTAYDWEVTPGVYNTNDGSGYSTGFEPAAWRGDKTTVKYGTRAGVSATRSGSHVTITATASRYSATARRFVPYANRVVAIEHCLTNTSGCSLRAYAKTDAAGRARITISAPALRSYRVTFGENSTYWGATSARYRR